ncbi:uncharacterized protein LOC144666209 [Oculina patagonica]
MAAAATSPLASSEQKTNGAKLSRLLIDGGTTVLRNVFDSYHPPANLASDLNLQYKTLLVLSRRRILNKSQWDKLFPPSGATPDSKTYDITLLFLLLTNICGLTTPPSGWHSKPPPSDTSLEANLARIKFFRNELYGHVTSTCVDTPTFNSLWQEISAVLVDLGLGQAEIDRLSAERCGEDDYLDVLRDWADSDEDIKSQLKEIRQGQTETQQQVEKVLQIQLEDHKTLAAGISKLEQVHQIENKMHQAVKEARQTQLEDHKTLQDSISKLECVSHTQKETRRAVEEVHETLQAGLQEVKQEFENSKRKREMDRADDLLKTLAKSEFKGDIEYHAQRFQEGTRGWIFKKVDDWLDDLTSQNRVMVISGDAGMGKSVVSAVVCKRMQKAGRLSGSHFCQHNNVRYRKPQLMLQSLACHLSHALPEYKNALVEQLSRNLGPVELNNMGVEELFALLFKEPLSTIPDPGRNILMVIDGLDESEYQGRNELLDVIANQFCKLPQWIRFFVTTRSEINIAESLKNLQPIQLEGNQEENLKDIQLFLGMQLIDKIEEEHTEDLLQKLVDKSEGVFLYAYFLVDFIQKNVSLLTEEQLESTLPLGISSVFLSHFKRLENELCKELKVEEDQMLSFLCALTASREPLPVAFVYGLLSLSGRHLSVQRRINKAIACISSLLPVRDGCLHFFHKSVKDWLTNISCYGRHDFTVEEKEGHEILSSLCKNELDRVKQKGVREILFSDTEIYALQHGVQHMIEVGKLDELSTYVTDVELIYAKLCVSTTSCLEEFFSVQMQAKVTVTEKLEDQAFISSLFLLLRKHSYLLRHNPHLFFQCVFNEGGPELSSRAAAVLETKLPHLPYMKYVNQEDQLGAVQARFYCSDTVACFDVSQQLDRMVCECRNGTIHLWSLHTGNEEWVKTSFVKKDFFGWDTFERERAFRQVEGSLSYYQSVVFYPSGEFVLPGCLRSVYSLNGELISLFPKSTCTFSNCKISGDKKRMLADSPNNTKEIILWSMENGEELTRINRNEDISCFALSQDGSYIAISDFACCISVFFVQNEGSCVMSKRTDSVCGLMHFTADNNTLVCGFLKMSIFTTLYFGGNTQFAFLTLPRKEQPQTVHLQDYVLWPCKSSNLTESDFLEQRQSSCWFNKVHNVIPDLLAGMYIMLTNDKALISSPNLKFVSAVNIALLNNTCSGKEQKVQRIIFSQNGDTTYCTSEPTDDPSSQDQQIHVRSINLPSLKITKIINVHPGFLLPVREGVLQCSNQNVLQLWNFDLTECIRPLNCKLMNTDRFIPISGELIGRWMDAWRSYVSVKVVNITNGEVIASVRTRDFEEDLPIIRVCCSTQQQVLTSTYEDMKRNPTGLDINKVTISLWNNDSSLMWEKSSKWFVQGEYTGQLTFSPQEEFVVTWNSLDEGNGVHVLDAKTGEILHRFLQSQNDIVDCKFVDCESLVCCSKDNFLRLFNIRSGDLLSVLDIEERPYCLGACLGKSLVAVGLSGARLKFIHVKSVPSITCRVAEDKKGPLTKRR